VPSASKAKKTLTLLRRNLCKRALIGGFENPSPVTGVLGISNFGIGKRQIEARRPGFFGVVRQSISAIIQLDPRNAMTETQLTQDRGLSARVGEAENPRSQSVVFGADKPLKLDAGVELSPFQIAYQTYGTLNAARSNAVLICHALTGDQHVANIHPVTGKPGWWETMVGPGKPIDTERYFVICSNVIGACMGTTGPSSINPDTGNPWGLDFPVTTIRDMVRAQAMLIDHLGIDMLFAVAGGSMGGMQVLQWAASFPERVFAALPIAAATRHSAQNIAFHEVGRQAVMADPDWRHGRYLVEGTSPRRGLAVARMGAHITYLSDAALHRKFGRKFQDRSNPTFSFDADFEVESYLRHQGSSFVERFDANSYLYLTRAMDYFDLAADYGGILANAFKGTKTRFCVTSFTSDWLFPTPESRAIVHALNASGARVSFAEIVTDKGHDAFLLDEPEFLAIVRGFLQSAAEARGLSAARG
jgi:homoserine O-acetyltransferase/O-succinyltransferase